MNLWVDGPSLAWKFAHIRGEPDIVGPFLQHLIKRLKNISVDRLAIFWDAKKSARRLALLPTYKANRSKKKGLVETEAIYQQMSLLRLKVFPALGIPQVWVEGHEGDDLIYAACQVFVDDSTIILSTDQDFVQLVSPTVSVILDLSGEVKVISERTVRDLLHVKSGAQFLLKRLITGDSSDNIPGIGGISGKKPGEGRIWPILAKCRDLGDLFKRREEFRKDPDFKLVFLPQAIEKLIRNLELMDLSHGEGSTAELQSQVMTLVLEGVGEISVGSIQDALSDNPGLLSEVLGALPYFDRVASRMLGE